MKLQHIVAAVALVASGAASANVLDPLATGGIGGEMSLTVYSESTQASVLIDTGVTLANFRSIFGAAGAKSYTLDLSGNAAFNSFLALAGNASDIRYTFFGGDNSGGSASARTMLTTVSGDATVVTNGNMVDSMNSIKNNYLDTANLVPAINPSQGGAANGSLLARKGVDGKAYFNEVVGSTFQGNFVDTSAAIGSSVAIYDFVRSDTTAFGNAIESSLMGLNGVASAKLALGANGYSFTVQSAVPEPTTYALAIAGLALVGVAARRRRA